jgi:CRP-like cAMP-binding protein
MSQTAGLPDGNKLLASLPPAEQRYLAAEMHVESPPTGEVVSTRTEPLAEILFPHDGVIALTSTDADGHSVQTALVGSEGCVGVETLLDQAPTLSDATIQIQGNVSVISARRFRAALKARPVIREAMLKYLYALSAQLLQATACDRLHSLDQRCCRTLLLMQDSTGKTELPLTQDSLAALLGGGRPRVNKVLGALERSGLLQRRRGRIRLLKRAGLEKRSCDCYRIVRRTFDNLGMPPKHH